MREFVKVASVVVFAAAILTVVIAWADDRPNHLTWTLRTAPVVVGLAALGVFLRIHFKRDLAPDYLHRTCGAFFDRGGFCFAVKLRNQDGFCVLNTYFQNRFEGRCVAKVALRPAKQFFGRANMDTIAIVVRCDGGAFGMHEMAVGIPSQLQGKTVKLEVGASVHYDEERGRMLRFRDGITLRANTDFGDTFRTAITVAGALGGVIILSWPATTSLSIPFDVSELIPAEFEPHTTILWRPGDAPIEI